MGFYILRNMEWNGSIFRKTPFIALGVRKFNNEYNSYADEDRNMLYVQHSQVSTTNIFQ